MNKILIFLLYIIFQPFVEFGHLVKSIFAKDAALSYPKTWQYVFLVMTIFSYLAKNKIWTNVFGILLVSTIIKTEWDSGKYMENYRKRIEKRAEEEIKRGGQQ